MCREIKAQPPLEANIPKLELLLLLEELLLTATRETLSEATV